MSHGAEEGEVVSSSSLTMVRASLLREQPWAPSSGSASASRTRRCIDVALSVRRRGMRAIIRNVRR
eukprot:1281204-Pyramimonas_sp.AAC.1